MSRRQRRWLGSVVLAGVSAGVIVLLAGLGSHSTVSASPEVGQVGGAGDGLEPLTLDVQEFCHMRDLRRQLCLSDLDLSALGCSGEAAESVLRSLYGWLRANRSAIDSLDAQAVSLERQLAQLSRKINVGPADRQDADRAVSVRHDLGDVSQRRGALISQAALVVEPLLSSQAKTVWQEARAGAAMPQELKFLSLSASEVRQLSAEGESGLPSAKRALLESLRANSRACSANVVAVSSALLPVPAELREDPSDVDDRVE